MREDLKDVDLVEHHQARYGWSEAPVTNLCGKPRMPPGPFEPPIR
jgi:hypothetical protein